MYRYFHPESGIGGVYNLFKNLVEDMAELVANKEQIINNLNKIEEYLNGSDETFEVMAKYIANGRVLLAYEIGGEWHYAPSRFVGYTNNSLISHKNNEEKDGRKTTPLISGILKEINKQDEKLEKSYKAYCRMLDVVPSNHKKTFWRLDKSSSDKITARPFIEGGRKMVAHLMRERNHKVVKEAKRQFQAAHKGKLYCEICGFDFSAIYGKIGEGFIEAHHKIELSSREGEHTVTPNDFLMVCSNCHSMIHRSGLSLLELKEIVK